MSLSVDELRDNLTTLLLIKLCRIYGLRKVFKNECVKCKRIDRQTNRRVVKQGDIKNKEIW